MLLPIYDSENVSAIIQKALDSDSVNAGLLFERYADIWQYSGKKLTREDPLSPFFERMVRRANNAWKNDRLLRAYHERMADIVKICAGESTVLKSSWRFATGLGQPHPTETGFKWDHNLGVPYLSGSSIKGALRSYMKSIANCPDNQVKEMLGSTEAVGECVILDAYPAMKPRIEIDILNVHYKDYYEESSPPADYLSPNPVFFLTVAPGTQFVFYLLPREKDGDLSLCKRYLKEAASILGFGAKTMVGYGQFGE